MEIQVEYRNGSGITNNQTHNMSRIAFAKHMAFAGQAFMPSTHKIIRTISMFFHYHYYIQKLEYNERNCFSLPPKELSDPTEQGQFSNIAGKAIADFLSKRIDNSLITVNYEAAMRIKGIPVKGKRPDLIALSNDFMFAIEAKGFAKNSAGNMDQHKNQSQAGGIPVNFTVACVSYNLYEEVKCKYYDPVNDNIEYNNELLAKLTKEYYSGLLGFLNKDIFEINEIEIKGEKFYEVGLSEYFERISIEFELFCDFRWFIGRYEPKLILPINIEKFAINGIDKETKFFKFEYNKNNKYDLYIDSDRVGFKINIK